MKKFINFLVKTFIIIPLMITWVSAQSDIWTHTFETSGGYSTSITEFTDNSEDYFLRTDGSDISGGVSFTGILGSYYFAAQDIDGEGASLPVTLTFDDIDISTYSNLTFYVYVAEDDASDAAEDWDPEDLVHIDYDIDNTGTFSNLIHIESSGTTNTTPAIDTNFDGTGDGSSITNTFTEFSASITGTGNTIDIKVTFDLDSGDEDIALDNFRITGTTSTTTVQFTASSASVSEGSGTYNLDVSITNPDGSNATNADVVLISGSAADIDNYTTETVTFPAGSSDNQTVTITITDDSEIEGNETLTFELQNVTGGNSAAAGTPGQFDLTIEDNDLPNAWINEIHYDNSSTDANEGVEVLLENAGNYTLSNFSVDLYNGSGGTIYGTETLDQFTEGSTVQGFTFYSWKPSSIQNDNEGICLSYNGNVIQFLSYEGTVSATEGPANGQTSTDIGVEETGSTLATQSMQLTGNGTKYSDFTWQADLTQTWGTQNDGGDQSLPVELTAFTAFAGDGQVTLRWQTASEINNAGFIILRSLNEQDGYQQVDSYRNNPDLKGAGTTSAENSYRWIDRNVNNNLTYWYKLVDVDINGRRTEHGPVSAVPRAENSEINQMQGVLPEKFNLRQNYPNPFNPQTSVRFDLPMVDDGMLYVRLEVFDLIGQKVRTLINGEIPCGSYTVRWNGLNEQGRPLPSGIYFCRLATSHYSKSRKMVLAR